MIVMETNATSLVHLEITIYQVMVPNKSSLIVKEFMVNPKILQK